MSFRFKQFTVCHDLCAMKVGTDGVLLGAWATCLDAENMLDIGTGSGLIALMLAQRCPAKIDALDIDENAYKQAQINFKNSPFSDRLQVYFSSLQDFSSGKKYDLIVSNPPYFSHFLHSPDKGRTQARHDDTLPLTDLLRISRSLLSPTGRLALILPFDVFDVVNKRAWENGLSLLRRTLVSPLPGKAWKRILLEYSTENRVFTEDELFIEQSPHVYSEAYIALTRDFYLKM